MLSGGIFTLYSGLTEGTGDMEVTLGLECRVEEGILHVHYVLTNNGRLPLLAYDGAPGLPPDAPWPDLKGQLYVSVVGDAVALKRVNPPLPSGVQVNRVFIPPLSQTLPGQRREVRFQCREPVTERSEYTPDFSGATYRERSVHTVELYLGCFWKTDNMDLVPFAANPNAFRLKQAHGPQSLVSARSMQTVHVKERTDPNFQRT